MPCPLCDYKRSRPSWMGSVLYQGKEFEYVECLSCKTLYCDPMPDSETLAQMYGPEYAAMHSDNWYVDDPKQPQRVVDWLGKLKKGVFIDYGCARGHLLSEALRLGWEAIGVELDERVAKATNKATGAKVVSDLAELGGKPIADVLNLGDVIEHLTRINQQLPEILRLIKPNGILLAQGPLEGNANLFTFGLHLARMARRSRWSEGAPYHVILATTAGQERMFRRFGLEQIEYFVNEVSWPAPSRLSRKVITQPRLAALFVLRRLSQGVSKINPQRMGNRYFYVGRLGGLERE